jgi:decaprenylphospho-beta-D-erythro-pentofuranosid-2-ulose 2-reductase
MIDAVGNPQSVLLMGGTSEIGLAVVEAFASDRPLRVVLAARPSERLDAARARLERLGCAVETLPFDALALDTHADVVRKAFTGGDIDVALVAFGLLGDNEKAWTDVATAVEIAQVNYTAAVSGHGGPTSSTAPPRPAWTPSTPGSPRRCARPASPSPWCAPGSCTPG